MSPQLRVRLFSAKHLPEKHGSAFQRSARGSDGRENLPEKHGSASQRSARGSDGRENLPKNPYINTPNDKKTAQSA